MTSFLQDVLYAFRTLPRSPAFAVVSVLSLALGIGANTTIFTVIHAVLLKPLPMERPAELVSVYTLDRKNPGYFLCSYPNYQEYRDQNSVFSGLVLYSTIPLTLNAGGQPDVPAGGGQHAGLASRGRGQLQLLEPAPGGGPARPWPDARLEWPAVHYRRRGAAGFPRRQRTGQRGHLGAHDDVRPGAAHERLVPPAARAPVHGDRPPETGAEHETGRSADENHRAPAGAGLSGR